MELALALLGKAARPPHPGPDALAWQDLSDHEFGEHILALYDAGRFGEAVSRLQQRDRERPRAS
jgi:hypothetical protein